MARRKQSLFEDLIEAASIFPWWVGVASALVAYVISHYFAGQQVAVPTDIKGLGEFAGKQMWITLAMLGQYLVPAAFLIGAGVSAYGRRKRERLHDQAGAAANQSVLNDISWQEFEMLVGEAFRHRGFAVVETGGAGADGGVDLVLSRGTEKFLVQCKQWRALKVGVTTVRELYGVMAARGAAGGFVVTSGEFTKDAIAFASGRNIELLNGAKLATMIQEARRSLKFAPNGEPVPRQSARCFAAWLRPRRGRDRSAFPRIRSVSPGTLLRCGRL